MSDHTRLLQTHLHLHTAHLPYTGPGTQASLARHPEEGCEVWVGLPAWSASWIGNVVRVGRKPTQIFFWNLSFSPFPKVIVTIFRLIGISHSSILCVSKNICMSLTMYYVHSVWKLNSRRNLEARQHHCPQGHHRRHSHHSRHRHHPPPCQKASATWKRAKGSQQWPPFKNNTYSSAVPI